MNIQFIEKTFTEIYTWVEKEVMEIIRTWIFDNQT